MPSPSNASYLIIARFVFVFLNIISISEVLKKIIIDLFKVGFLIEIAKITAN